MKRTFLKFFILLILASFTLTSEACRFTVREIGFSLLSSTTYTLVIVDDQAAASSAIAKLQARVKGANMKVLALSAQRESEHPFIMLAKNAGLKFPTAFLLAPDNRLCRLFDNGTYSLSQLAVVAEKKIIHSPLRQQLLTDNADTFAYVVRIPGKNVQETTTVDRQIQEDCARVKDIMSLMPKQVKNPPKQLLLTAQQCNEEQVVLWSLGLDSVNLPEHPVVHIIYGRGRFMGNGLQLSDIHNGNIYRYLAMVGADCECNLDRTWMLGTQLPMLWEGKTRQALASSLGFDVDNPLIQAEMSRILSKEEPGGNSTISFTPETIDLDEVFDSEDKPQLAEQTYDGSTTTASKTTNVLWITLGSLFVLVVLASGYIFMKRKED